MGRPEHHCAEGGDDRIQGQYEKDPWRADWRPEPPRRGQDYLEPDWRAGRPRPVGDEERGPDDRSAQPERRYPPGAKGYQRCDERLREDISERLMEARYIDSSDVTVEVSGAKVVLEGTVPQRPMKHAIEDLVDACPGVQDIDNRIRVQR